MLGILASGKPDAAFRRDIAAKAQFASLLDNLNQLHTVKHGWRTHRGLGSHNCERYEKTFVSEGPKQKRPAMASWLPELSLS